MDNASTATSVLRFSLFLTRNGDKVRTLHTGKLGRIYAAAINYEWDTAEIIIKYGDIGLNEGVYHCAEDLKKALSAFVEQENRDYIFGSNQ